MSNILSPYKQRLSPDALDDIKTRYATYQAGKTGNHYKAAVRNPAYCYVMWPGGRAPIGGNEWYATYRESRHRKPTATLESAAIRLGVGENSAFQNELNFTIKVFTKDDFADVVDNLCVRGNTIDIEFGYILPHAGGYRDKKIARGYKLCLYTFDINSDGTFSIKCTAVGPAIATKGLNANFRVDTKNRFYKVGTKTYPVTGIAELIAFWAQGNGQKSIDQMQDGDVLKPPPSTKTNGKPQELGSILIYDSEHLSNKTGGIFGSTGTKNSDDTNEVSKTNNIVYVSLETIVGLFNSEILPMYAKTATGEKKAGLSCDFSELSIEFDPDLSFSYIDPDIRSAYPTKVLFLNEKLGNYKNIQNRGKDFWIDLKDQASAKIGDSGGEVTKMDLKRIYIERTVILEALKSLGVPESAASTIDNRVNKEASTDIAAFFTKIFNAIKEATGDRISLVLSAHPDAVWHLDESKQFQIFIFDETNGYQSGAFPVWEFDPIDGDGVTRTCTIKGDVGGQNYQNSMYYGTHGTGGDALAKAEGVYTLIEAAKVAQRADAIKSINEIITDPGSLGDSAFDETHMQSLKSQFVALKDCELKKFTYNRHPFIGLGCDIELDGVWGIGPGAGVWSTQLPLKYKKGMVYFNIMTVTHEFFPDSSDWSTRIEGQLDVTELVKYEPRG